MKYFRKTWFRSLIISVALVVAALLLADEATTNSARESASRTLLGATLLFAICSAISIAMFTNYVRGLNQAYEDKVSDVRDLLEAFFDDHKDSDNPDIKIIISTYIIPLLSLNMDDWHAFDPAREILPQIDEPATRLHKSNPAFVPRYLLRIEDTINQVGILYVRRVLSQLHTDNVSGTFILVAFGIAVLALSNFLPQTSTGNIIVVWLSLSVVVFAIVELLLILSYLRQEAREELPKDDVDEGEPLIDAEKPNHTVKSM
ncbi:MAG: hypothetical protein HY937_00060 [Nitrosomonadales bacterium]|nr:hypothetical protein [Nitrosomonadales bacterium]